MTYRFFALPESFRDERVLLDSGETRHLRDVLRLAEGANVNVFDGCGREFSCTVVEIKKAETELLVLSELSASSPESNYELTLAAAMLKGKKFDLIVQKAVELGVTRLMPLQTKRCDVKPRDAIKRVERWRKIALESSKQTGRAKLMRVDEPFSLAELMSSEIPREEIILFSEREGEAFSSIGDRDRITAVVGPEGGWDDEELNDARSSGIAIVTLGGRILRAETAAIALAAVLQHRFGDLN